MDDAAFLPAVVHESAAYADILRAADLDAPVPSCPGWSVHRLTDHLGRVQRNVSRTVADPTAEPRSWAVLEHGPDGPAVIDWFVEGAAALVAALTEFAAASAADATSDPDAATVPTWAGPQPPRFWPRRMAHEAAVHRWDAASAGPPGVEPAPIAPDLAADGIDELFDVFVRHRLAAEAVAAFGAGSLLLRALDTPRQWSVTGTGESLTCTPLVPDSEPVTRAGLVLEGSASALLLFLWGRTPATALAVAGDDTLADRWQAHIRF